jgi:pre-mRNA-processing factor 19
MSHTLTDPKRRVSSVCFSADGNLLVSGSYDKTLKIWSVGSSGNYECQSTLTGHRYVPSLWKERLL